MPSAMTQLVEILEEQLRPDQQQVVWCNDSRLGARRKRVSGSEVRSRFSMVRFKAVQREYNWRRQASVMVLAVCFRSGHAVRTGRWKRSAASPLELPENSGGWIWYDSRLYLGNTANCPVVSHCLVLLVQKSIQWRCFWRRPPGIHLYPLRSPQAAFMVSSSAHASITSNFVLFYWLGLIRSSSPSPVFFGHRLKRRWSLYLTTSDGRLHYELKFQWLFDDGSI